MTYRNEIADVSTGSLITTSERPVKGLCHIYIELSRSEESLPTGTTMELAAAASRKFVRASFTRLSDACRVETGRLRQRGLDCEVAWPGRERP
jgi:hypothetical protein